MAAADDGDKKGEKLRLPGLFSWSSTKKRGSVGIKARVEGKRSRYVNTPSPSPPPSPSRQEEAWKRKGKEIADQQDDDANMDKKKKRCGGSDAWTRWLMLNKVTEMASKEWESNTKKDIEEKKLSSWEWVLGKFRQMGAPDQQLTRVMSKKITKSDILKSQNRLLLSSQAVRQSSLLEGLMDVEAQDIGKKGLSVVVVDRNGHEYTMLLKYLCCNNGYRIIGKWGLFVEDNDLKAGVDTVHLCLFHVPAADGGGKQQLRLGIIKVPE